MRKLNAAVVVFAALGFLGADAIAEVTKTKTRGETASAFSSQTDGCVFTNLEVDATEQRTKDAAGKTISSSLTVRFDQFDICTQTGLLNAFGQIAVPQGALSVAKNLSGADVHTTVQLTDQTGAPFPMTLNLHWQSTGDEELTRAVNKMSAPGTLTVDRSRQAFAFNAVISGAVAAGGVTLTDFTGQLFSDLGTSMTKAAVGTPPFLRGPSSPASFTSGKGYAATADISGISGCVSTTLSAGAFQNDSPPAPGESGMKLSIFMSQFDSCVGQQKAFVIGEAPIPVGGLTIAKNLSSASLLATVAFFDYTSEVSIPVSFDLRWAATESGTQGKQRTVSAVSGVVMQTVSKGTFASAQVSGSVSTPIAPAVAGADAVGSLSNQQSRTTLVTPTL